MLGVSIEGILAIERKNFKWQSMMVNEEVDMTEAGTSYDRCAPGLPFCSWAAATEPSKSQLRCQTQSSWRSERDSETRCNIWSILVLVTKHTGKSGMQHPEIERKGATPNGTSLEILIGKGDYTPQM